MSSPSSGGDGDGAGSVAHDRGPPTSSKDPQSPAKSVKSGPKSERDKRTYRACLHCRQRKSRCDLYSSGEPGRPPCERCIREQHLCVLGGSRRGGRRVKRTRLGLDAHASLQTFEDESAMRSVGGGGMPSLASSLHGSSTTMGGEQRPYWPPQPSHHPKLPPPSPQEPPVYTNIAGAVLTVEATVATHDIQNPADALEFLAHVAERDSDSNQLAPMHGYGRPHRASTSSQRLSNAGLGPDHQRSNVINYPPLTKGQVKFEMIQTLLARFEDKYHQFFPLANPAALDIQNLAMIAEQEPHLLAAILTVASKDQTEWWHIHEACSAHMQSLISDLVYNGAGSVEAIEALLILAEWVPRRTHQFADVGRGEEDRAAWMYVGTAIRLGYLLGIDRTGFCVENEVSTADINRARLAWAACYMSDRQISVRIGKAFWSRGPGPMTALHAANFPSLTPRLGRRDDFASIFQANLELTQLFSNAHDVLYATKSRSQQLNIGGEYVKYIDDFRASLRSWHSTWGFFSCSPPLKASLILSYEYLRLYVNAFAYQATLNRLLAQVRAPDGQQRNPLGAELAATPDARFIYDSIDAAKSLLSTFNSFVDPRETFCFMPLRYYLYVIYSACFLYKARATGVMGGDSRGSIKQLIVDTIDRLQKASACPNDVGDRYSRLIRALWRRNPSSATTGRNSISNGSNNNNNNNNNNNGGNHRNGNAADGLNPNPNPPNRPHHHPPHHPPAAPPADVAAARAGPGVTPTAPRLPSLNGEGQVMSSVYDPVDNAAAAAANTAATTTTAAPRTLNTFSWLDLSAVGEYALGNNNSSIAGSYDRTLDRFDESPNDGFAHLDPEFTVPHYHYGTMNDASGQNFIF